MTEHHHDHDWKSQEYVDYWIGQDVTRDEDRQEHLRRMAALLPYAPDAEIRVLDVGAGYGAASRAVLETFPKAHVLLHDFSAPMLQHARQRLGSYENRISQAMADLTDPAWVQAIGEPVDGVVSAIAIHNLRNPEAVARVYADIFTIVKPGGAFLNWELVWPGDAAGAANVRAEAGDGAMASVRRDRCPAIPRSVDHRASRPRDLAAQRTEGPEDARYAGRPPQLAPHRWIRRG